MSIRAVIWDIGGVLLRTEDRAPRAAAAARLGLTYQELENLVFNSDLGTRAQLGEISQQELWQGVAQELKLPPTALPWLQEAFFGGDRLDTSLLDFIRSLRPKYKTGVISNAWKGLRELMIEQWKIVDTFDHLVGSGDVGIIKPDPRIYRLSLQGLHVEPQEAVFIDDNQKNIVGAQAVGMHGIRFITSEQARADLESLLKNG